MSVFLSCVTSFNNIGFVLEIVVQTSFKFKYIALFPTTFFLKKLYHLKILHNREKETSERDNPNKVLYHKKYLKKETESNGMIILN